MDPDTTYVDLNRSGVALMEIVSEPDIRSPEEAGAYLTKLRAILRYLGTCDGNMEEGSMRADVNVSVRRPGEGYGTRCEIKNVNSIRFVQQAIVFEAARQVELIEGGGTVVQETRLFDAVRGETRSMRSKEEAHDYRYFPDPDLLPLELDPHWVEKIKAGLPELPDEKHARFQIEFGLNRETASVLVSERDNALFFENSLRKVQEKTNLAPQRWAAEFAGFFFDFLGRLDRMGLDVVRSPVSDARLSELFSLKLDGTISGPILKNVLDEMLVSEKSALQIVEEKGLRQITDSGAIEAAVDKVIASAPKQVEQFRSGNEKILGWFVGQIMKATGGKANPAAVNEILRKKLSN
jgi:aspartyl-tRNA(Asn)/glutamyl-tRNA(Gln) amidotransferase subunit B